MRETLFCARTQCLIMIKKRVCAIVAHPDDETIFCGGYLAREDVEGHAIVLTLGGLGTWGEEISRDELRAIRKEEAQAAAQVLGISLDLLELREGEVSHQERNIREQLVDLIREIRPHIVLTHDWDDEHFDHREVALLVRDAATLAGLPNFTGKKELPAWKTLNVYTFDKHLEAGNRAAIFIDISETAGKKIRALRKHKSQNKHSVKGASQVAAIEMMGLVLGSMSGVPKAEKFIPLRTKGIPDFPEFLLGEEKLEQNEEP